MILPFVPNSLSASVTIPMGTADMFTADVTYCDVPFVAAVFTTIDVVVVDDEEDTGNKSQSLSYSLIKGNNKYLYV